MMMRREFITLLGGVQPRGRAAASECPEAQGGSDVDHTEDSCGDGRRLDGCGKVLIRWRGPTDCEDHYRAVHDRLRGPRNQAVCQKQAAGTLLAVYIGAHLPVRSWSD